MWARAFAAWLLIIFAESLHGTARMLWLAPAIGDLPARQVSVATGALIIFVIAYLTVGWIDARGERRLLLIGAAWVVLTILFEVALGRLVLGLTWDRVTEDYDVTRGGLMWLGLLFLLFVPVLAVRVQHFMHGR